MGSIAATRCWGVVFICGIVLPLLAQTPPPAGQQVPVPPPRPAAAPAPAATAAPQLTYETVWSVPAPDETEKRDITLTPKLALLTGARSLTAHDLADGHVVWTLTGEFVGPPALTETAAVMSTPAGLLTTVDLAGGREIWHVELGAPTTGPVTHGAEVLVTAGPELRAYRFEDGGQAWRLPLGSPARTPIVLAGQRAVLALEDRSLVYVDLASHSLLGRIALDFTPIRLLLIADRVFVGLDNGGLAALSLPGGRVLWNQTPRARLEGTPIVDRNLAYFTRLDNIAWALRAGSGSVQWHCDLPSRPKAGARLAGLRLFVPLENGEIAYCATRDGRLGGTIPLPKPATEFAADRRLDAGAISLDGNLIVRATADYTVEPPARVLVASKKTEK